MEGRKRGRRDRRRETGSTAYVHTDVVVLLVPDRIAFHVSLWFVMMIVSVSAAEHLVEEGELCNRGGDKRQEREEKHLRSTCEWVQL